MRASSSGNIMIDLLGEEEDVDLAYKFVILNGLVLHGFDRLITKPGEESEEEETSITFGCTFKGMTYNLGDTVHAVADCMICICEEDGAMNCHSKMCEKECFRGTIPVFDQESDKCCPWKCVEFESISLNNITSVYCFNDTNVQ